MEGFYPEAVLPFSQPDTRHKGFCVFIVGEAIDRKSILKEAYLVRSFHIIDGCPDGLAGGLCPREIRCRVGYVHGRERKRAYISIIIRCTRGVVQLFTPHGRRPPEVPSDTSSDIVVPVYSGSWKNGII